MKRFFYCYVPLVFAVLLSFPYITFAQALNAYSPTRFTELQFKAEAVKTKNVSVQERVFTVKRLGSDAYQPGVILVKTRSSHSIAKGTKSLQSTSWSAALQPLLVKEIRAPFATEGTSLQAAQSPFGIERIYEIRYESAIDAYDACVMLANNPDVEYATPVYNRYVSLTPNDSQYASQYAMGKIQAPQAWDISTGSGTVTIAIIDSGTDFEHEDLAGNLWTNPGETGTDAQGKDKRTNGKDDDNNGKIDDYRGWDFVGNITAAELVQGIVKEDNDPKVRATTIVTEHQHGTETAGSAAAVSNNVKGVASTGFTCKYIPIKCGTDANDKNLVGKMLRGYEAITYAARLGATIINCSWGGPGDSPAEQDIINNATASGSIVVAAAGNETMDMDKTEYFPACYDNVLCIGATNNSDKVAYFSNYGLKVCVYAPGTGIRTTKINNQYGDADGTSFSCPIAAGVVGLIKTLHPDWSEKQIFHQLRATCDNVVNTSNRKQFYGRLNAYNALNVNRTLNSGTTAPGLEITGVKFNNQTTITSTDQQTAIFTIENYLSTANNVTVTLAVTGNDVSLSQTTFTIPTVSSLSEATFQCFAQVKVPAYFVSTSVTVQATITAGTFVHYQTFTIPVNLKTENSFSSISASYGYTWTAIHTKPPLTTWAVGRTSTNRVVVMKNTTYDSTSITDVPTCVWGNSTQIANVGTSNSRVYHTGNGGTNWSAVPVSTVTSVVYNINFFDSNNGIIIGAPHSSGSWFTGITTNAGTAWAKGVTMPTPLSGETTQSSAIVWNGDVCWIGTTKGRIIKTTDKGQTWNTFSIGSSDAVTQLAFSTTKNGFALVRTSPTVSVAAKVYTTTDGGETWAATGYQFNQAGVHPVYAYAPVNSLQLLAVCSGSQVMASVDNGKTWNPVLTNNTTSATAGFGTTSGTATATIYVVGKELSSLRIPFVGAAAAQISVASTLTFDSVLVGAQLLKDLAVQNPGSAALNLTDISLSGADAADFSITNKPTTIAASGSDKISIQFKPNTEGTKQATLTIKHNAGNDAVVQITGIGKKVNNTSVLDDAVTKFTQVFPNPANDNVTFAFTLAEQSNVNLVISDLLGNDVVMVHNGVVDAGYASLQASTTALSAGVYVYRLRVGSNTYSQRFVVVH